MACLLDTNVLARLANAADALFTVADQAVTELHRRGEVLHVTAQNFIEFRSLATRPPAVNGLGLSAAETAVKSGLFEATFRLLPETPDIYPTWKALAEALGEVGKRVHDARLVAVCNVHHVSGLLTFNAADFAGMAGFGPGITVIDPTTV